MSPVWQAVCVSVQQLCTSLTTRQHLSRRQSPPLQKHSDGVCIRFYAFHVPSPRLSHSVLASFPPAAAHYCQMHRRWACWRMARVQRPPSGFKCSNLSAALTPTSSSTATSRSVTAPRGCVGLWVNPVTLIPHTASQNPVQTSSLLDEQHESLI